MSDLPQRTIEFMKGYWNVDRPIKEFCSKMELELMKAEKERDEAQEALRILAEHGESKIQKLIKERDEARNKMADALQEVDLRTLDYERMKSERDDALSQIFQAECRAERFCQERDMARELADQWRQESNWIGNEPTYKFPWEAAK
jgi:hypothetical protein